MFYRNCGKELIDTSAICSNYGAKLISDTGFCSDCGTSLTPITKICVKFGARVAITRYPSSIEVKHPKKTSRLTSLLRFFMSKHHYFVSYFIGIAAWLVVFISWWGSYSLAYIPGAFLILPQAIFVGVRE